MSRRSVLVTTMYSPLREAPPQLRFVNHFNTKAACFFQLAAGRITCEDKCRLFRHTVRNSSPVLLDQRRCRLPAQRRKCPRNDDRLATQDTVACDRLWLLECELPHTQLFDELHCRMISKVIGDRVGNHITDTVHRRDTFL